MATRLVSETPLPPMTVVQLGDDNCRIEARGNFSDKDAQDYVPNPESEQLRIDVPVFEGPFDLLLHLIKKHSMDIFDIPIVVITQKYLEVLDELRELDLDLAGDFLVMAATLAQIKSKMLLPPDEQAAQEGDDEGEIEDPRAELVRRLLEYQKYKQAAAELKEMHSIGTDSFTRRGSDLLLLPSGSLDAGGDEVPLSAVEVFELIELFAKALEKNKPKFAHTVQFERVSVRARLSELIDFSRLRHNFNFDDALRYFNARTKIDIIVTFLSILEMAKLKLIKVEQDFQTRVISLTAIQENLSVAQDELLSDLNDDELPN